MLGATLNSPSRRARRTYGVAGVAPAHPMHLTPRQHEVVKLLCDGLGYKEIATALGLTEGTVKVYAAYALRGTGATNRTQLAVWWTQGRFNPPVVDVFPGVDG
jgi:DNA-binding NarL/FixJ family response regulator